MAGSKSTRCCSHGGGNRRVGRTILAPRKYRLKRIGTDVIDLYCMHLLHAPP